MLALHRTLLRRLLTCLKPHTCVDSPAHAATHSFSVSLWRKCCLLDPTVTHLGGLNSPLPSAAELRSHQPQLVQAMFQPLINSVGPGSTGSIRPALVRDDLQAVLRRMLHVDVRQRASLAEVARMARDCCTGRATGSINGNRRVRAAAFAAALSDESESDSEIEQDYPKRRRR